VLKVTRKFVRRFLWGCLLLFVALNVVAMLHAYKFTHFASNTVEKTQSAEQLSSEDAGLARMKTLHRLPDKDF
jgi:hypothetical protein